MKKIADGKENIKSLKVVIPTGEDCPDCGEPLVKRKGRYGEFISCSTFPKCKYTKNLGKIEKKPQIVLSIKCPDCGGDIVERMSRRGKFFGCGNYPKCKFIANFEPTDKKCPECEGMMGKKELKTKRYYECFKCKHKEEF